MWEQKGNRFIFISFIYLFAVRTISVTSVATPDGAQMIDLARRSTVVSRIAGRGQVFIIWKCGNIWNLLLLGAHRVNSAGLWGRLCFCSGPDRGHRIVLVLTLTFCSQAPSAISQTVRYNLRSSRNQVSRLFVAVVLYQIWLSSGSGSPRCSSICTPARCRATCASCLVAGTWGWPALNVTTFPNVPSWDGRSVPI